MCPVGDVVGFHLFVLEPVFAHLTPVTSRPKTTIQVSSRFCEWLLPYPGPVKTMEVTVWALVQR